MSRRIGNVIIIEPEEDDTCESCGAIEETRPYGPGGSRICIACAREDPMVDARMRHVLFGEPDPEAAS